MGNTTGITGDTTGTVTEDTSLVVSGSLKLDVEIADPFIAQSTDGQYGNFNLSASGDWEFTLANDLAVVQELGAGDSVTDRFLVTWSGLDYIEVIIDIQGNNDAATIIGDTLSSLQAPVQMLTSGMLIVSDIDQNEDYFLETTDQESELGFFSLESSGAWNYSLRPEILSSGILSTTEIQDIFTVRTADGSSSQVKINVTLNDTVQSGTDGNDDITGDQDANTFLGGEGDDLFEGREGNDLFNGGTGIDMARFGGNLADYDIHITSSSITVSDNLGTDGSDTTIEVERFSFRDVNLAFDLEGNAGNTAKLLGAVFGAESVSNKVYAGIGIDLLDNGMSYEDLAELAISVTGATTHQQIVELLWKNVVGFDPTAEQSAPFITMLNDGMAIGELGVLAAEHELNQLNIGLTGLMQSGLAFLSA